MPRSLEEILANADQLADVFEAFDPAPRRAGSATTLIALQRAASKRIDADRSVLAAVAASRAAGTSWAVIGKVLGTSGEAARQRYSAFLPRAR